MPNTVRVLYDGHCPFCANYQKLWRFRARHDAVELIDARERPDLVEHYANAGHHIDESFIVDVDGKVLTDGAALAYIHGQLASQWTGLPLIANERLLMAIYPFLRAGRNAALKLLGHQKIRPQTTEPTSGDAGESLKTGDR